MKTKKKYEKSLVRNLLKRYEHILPKHNNKIRKFQETDCGPSTVTLYLKDPLKRNLLYTTNGTVWPTRMA